MPGRWRQRATGAAWVVASSPITCRRAVMYDSPVRATRARIRSLRWGRFVTAEVPSGPAADAHALDARPLRGRHRVASPEDIDPLRLRIAGRVGARSGGPARVRAVGG